MKTFAFLSLLVHAVWFGNSTGTDTAEPFTRTISVRIEQNLMFTDVMIEGETYNFLIDTGAPFVLSPELARKLRFRPSKTMTIRSSNSKRGKAKVGTFRKKVEVGGLKFSNFKAMVLDYNANTDVIRCLGFDGIIGANFMNGVTWQVDYDAMKITITNRPRQLPDIDKGWSVKMDKRGFNNSPYIPAKVNRGDYAEILFDTGFSGFFDLGYKSYDNAVKSGKLDERIKIVEGRGIMSEGAFGAVDTTGYYIQVPQLIIGKETVFKPEFRMGHGTSAKVGAEYLKGRLVTFDFPGSRLYVYEKENSYLPVSRTSYLFAMTPERGSMFVSSVYGKLLESGELNLGDEVISIDGEVLSEMGECEAQNFVRNRLARQEPMNLRAKRDGKEFFIKIYKSQIFSD